MRLIAYFSDFHGDTAVDPLLADSGYLPKSSITIYEMFGRMSRVYVHGFRHEIGKVFGVTDMTPVPSGSALGYEFWRDINS